MKQFWPEKEPIDRSCFEYANREKYAVPFYWGNFHVTEQADEAYGLVPLSLEEHKPTPAEEALGQPAFTTDVWLVGPTEDGKLRWLLPSSDEEFGTQARAMHDKDAINVIVAFNKTASKAEELVRSQLESNEIEIPDDVSPDFLEQDMHQLIAHSIPVSIANATTPALEDLLLESANRDVLKKAHKNILMGLGGAAIETGFGFAPGASPLAGEIAGTGILIGFGGLVYAGFKKYLDSLPNIRANAAGMASIYAGAVADDIHRLYCANHFNWAARNLVGDKSPED